MMNRAPTWMSSAGRSTNRRPVATITRSWDDERETSGHRRAGGARSRLRVRAVERQRVLPAPILLGWRLRQTRRANRRHLHAGRDAERPACGKRGAQAVTRETRQGLIECALAIVFGLIVFYAMFTLPG